jgi:competence protein ComEC
MNSRPLAAFAAAWILGSAAASALGTRGVLLAGAALAFALLALALAKRLTLPLAAACLAAYAVAAGQRAWVDARNVSALAEPPAASGAYAVPPPLAVEAAGTIVSAVVIDGDRVSFRAQLASARVEGTAPRELRERVQVQLRLAEQPEQEVAAGWRRGDKVALAGELARPSGAVNIGGFDYRRYLHAQRIHWLLQADGADSVRVTGRERWSAAAALGRVDAVRDWLGGRMDRLFPAEQSGYMKGLVLGLRDDLDPELFRDFSQLGLTHILAISGLHVAVFLYGMGLLLRMCRLSRETMFEVLMAAVPLYVLLAGASPSVVRAGIMAVLGLFAARLGKLKDGLNVLAAAAWLMLLWNPYYLTDVSFQLSFIVTAGLILLVPPVRQSLPETKRLGPLLDLLTVSVVAQAVSFPLTIFYFNQFHLLSLPANVLLVPFISFVVMPLGSVALLLAAGWPAAGDLLAYGAAASNEATFAAVDTLGRAAGFRTIWPSPPLWWIGAWYAALLAVARLLPALGNARHAVEDRSGEPEHTLPLAAAGIMHHGRGAVLRRERRAVLLRIALLAAAAALLLAYAYKPNRFDRTAVVSFLDVGQGDAVHIRTPAGKHLLIDGGGSFRFTKPGEEWRKRRDPFEVGRKVVVPLLMKRGVQQIDLLVVSHLDTDHIGGLRAVLESIPVGMLLWNGSLKPSDDAAELLKLAAELEVPLVAAGAGMQAYRPDDGTAIQVLWPQAADASAAMLPIEEDQNERSVVLHVELGERTLLLGGDIGFAAERALLSRLASSASLSPPPPKPIDILKISHHGSRFSTSPEWLSYWRPLEAVASVGRTNTYGHPHPDVLSRVDAAGALLRRTDTDGEVQYRIAGSGLLRVRSAKRDYPAF